MVIYECMFVCVCMCVYVCVRVCVYVSVCTCVTILHPPTVQVTQETQLLLSTRGYEFEYRGLVPVKGKGSLLTYFLSQSSRRLKRPRTALQLPC